LLIFTRVKVFRVVLFVGEMLYAFGWTRFGGHERRYVHHCLERA
jgi:hypothetical protein